jgi:hypothetical protein
VIRYIVPHKNIEFEFNPGVIPADIRDFDGNSVPFKIVDEKVQITIPVLESYQGIILKY